MQIDRDDELVQSIRRAHKSLDEQDSALLTTVITRAKRLDADTRSDLHPTITAGGDSEKDSFTTDPPHVSHDLSFLSAAEGPDELGRLGAYRILKELGRGGMGVVFRAKTRRSSVSLL